MTAPIPPTKKKPTFEERIRGAIKRIREAKPKGDGFHGAGVPPAKPKPDLRTLVRRAGKAAKRAIIQPHPEAAHSVFTQRKKQKGP